MPSRNSDLRKGGSGVNYDSLGDVVAMCVCLSTTDAYFIFHFPVFHFRDSVVLCKLHVYTISVSATVKMNMDKSKEENDLKETDYKDNATKTHCHKCHHCTPFSVLFAAVEITDHVTSVKHLHIETHSEHV